MSGVDNDDWLTRSIAQHRLQHQIVVERTASNAVLLLLRNVDFVESAASCAILTRIAAECSVSECVVYNCRFGHRVVPPAVRDAFARLAEAAHLRALRLSVTVAGTLVNQFLRSIMAQDTLHSIAFADTLFASRTLETMATWLQRTSALHELHLINVQSATPWVTNPLLTALRSVSSLTSLSFSRTTLHNGGMITLAGHLQHQHESSPLRTNLRHIDLGHTAISGVAIGVISTVLCDYSALCDVSLAHNNRHTRVTMQAADGIARLIQNARHLTRLDLSDIPFETQHLASIFSALRRNSTLICVDLSVPAVSPTLSVRNDSAHLSALAVRRLIDVIDSNRCQQLHSLLLDNRTVDSTACEALLDALQRNTRLTALTRDAPLCGSIEFRSEIAQLCAEHVLLRNAIDASARARQSTTD